LYARGRAAYPDLDVPDDRFATHLGRCNARVRHDPASSIHAEDLYLACACLCGVEHAIETLIAAHQSSLIATLRPTAPSSDAIDDALQRFWDAALVGTMSAPPRIATYSGRGPLGGWIAVGVQRMLLMIRRHESAEDRARRFGDDLDAAVGDPELDFIKDRYRDQFQVATQKALAALDDRERMIFRLHLVDGVTIERIAQSYGVSHSTISRWFAGAREKVIKEAERAIRSELQISPHEFDSIKRLVLSQLDLSLSGLVAAAR
jgi:RNA polymerase sigma-70 factor (ECF subfamily)